MAKLHLIFLLFILYANNCQIADGFFVGFVGEFAKYMLNVCTSRAAMHGSNSIEKQMFGDGSRQAIESLRKELVAKMDRISNEISESTQKIINKLSTVIAANAKITVLMQSLMKEIHLVDVAAEQMHRISEHKDQLNSWTLKNVAENLVQSGQNTLIGALANINTLVKEKHIGGFEESVIVVFINYLNSLTIKKYCGRITAPRQQLYHFFSVLLATEMKGYTLLSDGYSLLETTTNESFDGEKKMLNATFRSHVENLMENFLKHFPIVLKYTYNCPPEQYVEGVNYAQISGLLPVHIYNERDIYSSVRNLFDTDCYQSCNPNKTYVARKKISAVAQKEQFRCPGALVGCRPLVRSVESLCIEKNAQKRHVKYKKPNKKCEEISLSPWLFDLRQCEYCTCHCDSLLLESFYVYTGLVQTKETDHVVTGIRFVYKNNTVFLQIQTGKLQAFGFVNASTIAWQPLPDDQPKLKSNLYEELTNKRFRFILRHLEIPSPYVMTGVQFFSKENTAFDLKLLGHQINLLEGKLTNSSMFFLKKKSFFEEVYANRKLPLVHTQRAEEVTIPSEDKNTLYVPLGFSDFHYDYSQTMVPFFDIRKVTSSIPMPLSGIALYHRANAGYAGFIAVKLIAIEPTEYMSAFLKKGVKNN